MGNTTMIVCILFRCFWTCMVCVHTPARKFYKTGTPTTGSISSVKLTRMSGILLRRLHCTPMTYPYTNTTAARLSTLEHHHPRRYFFCPNFQSSAFRNLFWHKQCLFLCPFRTGLKFEKGFRALLFWHAPEKLSRIPNSQPKHENWHGKVVVCWRLLLPPPSKETPMKLWTTTLNHRLSYLRLKVRCKHRLSVLSNESY